MSLDERIKRDLERAEGGKDIRIVIKPEAFELIKDQVEDGKLFGYPIEVYDKLKAVDFYVSETL